MSLFKVHRELPKIEKPIFPTSDMSRYFYNWSSLTFSERNPLEKFLKSNYYDVLKNTRIDLVKDNKRYQSDSTCIYQVGPLTLKDGSCVILGEYYKRYNRVSILIENIRAVAQDSGDISSDNLLLITVANILYHLFFHKDRPNKDINYPLTEFASIISMKEVLPFLKHYSIFELAASKNNIDAELYRFYELGHTMSHWVSLKPEYRDLIQFYRDFDISRLNYDRRDAYREYRQYLSFDSASIYAADKLIAVIAD